MFFDLIAVYNGYEPIYYSKALEEGATGLNANIEASILCVQQANLANCARSFCKVCKLQKLPTDSIVMSTVR